MRWGVKDKGQRRIEFVIRAASKKETMAALCEEFQISRPTGYLWLNRYKQGARSLTAVRERSRRPLRSPRKTDESIEAKVLQLRHEQGWGAKAIRHVLERDQGIRLGRMTVHRILERHGLIKDEDRHRPATTRFEREKPNELWQMDFKGQFPMGDRQCFPLSILDDHSRYLIGLQALDSTKRVGVQETLVNLFAQYGLPEAMLMDHGTPWWDSINGHGLTQLSVALIKQGIRLHYSGVRHPQTQGKVEKFHGTLQRTVTHRDCWPEDLNGWQLQFADIRQNYNHYRPHEALNMDLPAAHYQRSARSYQPEPTEWEYPSGSLVIRLNSQGQLYWKSRYRFVCRPLANEHVRIQQLDNKLLISYRHMWIREIDMLSGRGVPLITPTDEPLRAVANSED
jgi:transposase InsO family protein